MRTIPDLLTWLRETAASAARADLPGIQEPLAQSADLIAQAYGYTIRAVAEPATEGPST